MSEVNLGGRPRKYKTPEEFDDKVNEFVALCAASTKCAQRHICLMRLAGKVGLW